MIRTFTIEFPDDNGALWMNKDNLMMCLTTDTCCKNTPLIVTDITGDKCDPSGVSYIPRHNKTVEDVINRPELSLCC